MQPGRLRLSGAELLAPARRVPVPSHLGVVLLGNNKMRNPRRNLPVASGTEVTLLIQDLPDGIALSMRPVGCNSREPAWRLRVLAITGRSMPSGHRLPRRRGSRGASRNETRGDPPEPTTDDLIGFGFSSQTKRMITAVHRMKRRVLPQALERCL